MERFLASFANALDAMREKHGAWFTFEKPFINAERNIEVQTSACEFVITRDEDEPGVSINVA